MLNNWTGNGYMGEVSPAWTRFTTGTSSKNLKCYSFYFSEFTQNEKNSHYINSHFSLFGAKKNQTHSITFATLGATKPIHVLFSPVSPDFFLSNM